MKRTRRVLLVALLFAFASLAGGVGIRTATACPYNCIDADMNGNGTISVADLSVWLTNYFTNTNPVATDLNCDGVVSPADLSQWLTYFFACP
jgi:hypothetical protein